MYRKWGRTKPPVGATIDWGHPLAQGLAGCWLLNEGSGGVLTDLANKATGVLTGSPSWQSGRLGGPVLRFNAANYVSMGNVLGFDRFDKFSVSVWFRTTTATADRLLMSKRNNSSPFQAYYINLNPSSTAAGTVRWDLVNGAANFARMDSSRAVYNDGRWHHVVGTTDGSGNTGGMRLYLDGQSVGVTIGNSLNASIVTTAPLQLSGSQGNNFTFDGDADDFQIWNRVLTPTDVRQLYQEPFAMIRSPRAVQYFVPQAAPPPGNFNAGRVQHGVVIGGGCL